MNIHIKTFNLHLILSWVNLGTRIVSLGFCRSLSLPETLISPIWTKRDLWAILREKRWVFDTIKYNYCVDIQVVAIEWMIIQNSPAEQLVTEKQYNSQWFVLFGRASTHNAWKLKFSLWQVEHKINWCGKMQSMFLNVDKNIVVLNSYRKKW